MFLIRLISKKEMSLVRSVSEDTGMPPAPLCSDASGSAISPSFQLSQELGRSAPKLGQRQSPGCGRWTGRPLRGLLGPSRAALPGWGGWSQGIPGELRWHPHSWPLANGSLTGSGTSSPPSAHCAQVGGKARTRGVVTCGHAFPGGHAVEDGVLRGLRAGGGEARRGRLWGRQRGSLPGLRGGPRFG